MQGPALMTISLTKINFLVIKNQQANILLDIEKIITMWQLTGLTSHYEQISGCPPVDDF